MTVHLHIDRLILDGIDLPAGKRPELQTVLEAELSRLLARHDMPPSLRQGGAVPALTAPAFPLGPEGDTVHLGRQIARSVYGALRS
jgi:hypothetical protein